MIKQSTGLDIIKTMNSDIWATLLKSVSSVLAVVYMLESMKRPYFAMTVNYGGIGNVVLV